MAKTAVEALNSVLTEVAEMYVMGDGESREMAWFMEILQSRIAELDPEAAGEYDQAAIAVAVYSNNLVEQVRQAVGEAEEQALVDIADFDMEIARRK